MKRALLVCLVGVLMVSGVAQAADQRVIWDTFESYGSQVAFQAAWPTWGLNNTSAVMNYEQYGWPRTAAQNPEFWQASDGRCVQRYQGPAAANNYHNYKAVNRMMPTDAAPVVMQFDMFDSGSTGGGTNREWCSINAFPAAVPTAYGAVPYVAIGSNSATSGTAVTKWQFRIYSDASQSGMTFSSGTAWVNLNASRPGTAGQPAKAWTRFKVMVYATHVDFYVNNTLDTSVTVTNPNWKGFNAFHLGSGQSTNATMLIDNVMLATPEPASVVLLMGAGALLLRRRR